VVTKTGTANVVGSWAPRRPARYGRLERMPTADVQPTRASCPQIQSVRCVPKRSAGPCFCGDNRDPSLRMLSGSHVHHHDALAGFRMVDVYADPFPVIGGVNHHRFAQHRRRGRAGRNLSPGAAFDIAKFGGSRSLRTPDQNAPVRPRRRPGAVMVTTCIVPSGAETLMMSPT